MLKEIYTAAMGMIPQQTRMEVVANNLANASAVGFKRESVFERNLTDARANLYNVPGDAEQEDTATGSYVDFSQGAFFQTDNPLDIAIENKNGFFALRDEQGNMHYTKSGRFQVTKDGSIVSPNGMYLLGENGPLNYLGEYLLDPTNVNDERAIDIRIVENGEVFANENRIGAIQLVQVNNPDSLRKVDETRFSLTRESEVEFVRQADTVLRQGWLEDSNVDVINEMVTMIELQRMFELGSKVIKTNDGTLDDSLRIGRFY